MGDVSYGHWGCADREIAFGNRLAARETWCNAHPRVPACTKRRPRLLHIMERCKLLRQDEKQALPWLSELEPGTGGNGDACRA